MKTINLIYITIVIFLVVIIALVVGDKPALVTGHTHPEFKTMLKGGESIHSLGGSNVFGYLFGLCSTLLLCLFIAHGARRYNQLGSIKPWLVFGTLVYLAVFTLTYLSDATYVDQSHTQFFLGWPLPTAWMIYAMWFSPVIFVALYVFGFRDWILTEADEAKFNEILSKRRTRRAD